MVEHEGGCLAGLAAEPGRAVRPARVIGKQTIADKYGTVSEIEKTWQAGCHEDVHDTAEVVEASDLHRNRHRSVSGSKVRRSNRARKPPDEYYMRSTRWGFVFPRALMNSTRQASLASKSACDSCPRKSS